MPEPERTFIHTSSGRRFAAALTGIVVFVVCIVIAAGLINTWLGTGAENLSAAGLCWLAASFIAAFAGGACAGAIASDLDSSIFFYTLVTILVLLALFYAIGYGNNFGSWLRSLIMVIGGTMGAHKAMH